MSGQLENKNDDDDDNVERCFYAKFKKKKKNTYVSQIFRQHTLDDLLLFWVYAKMMNEITNKNKKIMVCMVN